jgi:hypothetical protein
MKPAPPSRAWAAAEVQQAPSPCSRQGRKGTRRPARGDALAFLANSRRASRHRRRPPAGTSQTSRCLKTLQKSLSSGGAFSFGVTTLDGDARTRMQSFRRINTIEASASYFDTRAEAAYPEETRRRRLSAATLPLRVPVVQRPRTPPFQGENTGSNPVGDANRPSRNKSDSICFELRPSSVRGYLVAWQFPIQSSL